MRRLVLVALVLPLVAGCAGSGQGLANEGGGLQRSVPLWVKTENLPAKAVPGASLFAVVGCTACHTYAGSGSQMLSAPDLTAEGARNGDVRFQIAHLKCPSCVHPGSPMPPFAPLGQHRLQQLALFLVASKGLGH